MTSKEVLSHYSGKSVLISGGAGAIGSNLARALLEAGPKTVTLVDSLASSFLWNLPEDDRVLFVKGSILDEETIKRAFSSRPDYVFHLAANFANQNSVDHPETDLAVNGLGTLRMLEYSNLVRPERFVFASSGCSVYGNEAPLPLRETFTSLHLDTPYQINKLLGELYCNYFFNYFELPVAIARYFNVFGPGEVPGKYRNVIPNYMYWALSKKPLPLMGTGNETRDFTYVGDIVEGTLRLGVYESALGEAFNLASGKETKISDLAKWVNDLTGNSAGIRSVPKRDWDKSTRRRASISKAKRMIGYEPKIGIQEGLEHVHHWFEANWENIHRSANF